MLTATLQKKLGNFALDVDFALPEVGMTVVFGKSGSGKTTVLNLLAGLLRPDAGRVALADTVFVDTRSDRFISPEKRRIGYVFQQPRLFSHLSVENNILFAPRFCGGVFDSSQYRLIVDLLGIGHLLRRRPNTLSGGEGQRVAIGRALMASARLLLMDEPLASLDKGRKDELLPYIARIPRELGITVVYVTHSTEELCALADSVLLLRNGRGEFLASPDELPDDFVE